MLCTLFIGIRGEYQRYILQEAKSILHSYVQRELYQNQIRPTTLEGSVATCLSAVLQDTNFKVGNISKTIEEKTGILKLTLSPTFNS